MSKKGKSKAVKDEGSTIDKSPLLGDQNMAINERSSIDDRPLMSATVENSDVQTGGGSNRFNNNAASPEKSKLVIPDTPMESKTQSVVLTQNVFLV